MQEGMSAVACMPAGCWAANSMAMVRKMTKHSSWTVGQPEVVEAVSHTS